MTIEIIRFQKQQADMYKVQVSHSRFMRDLDGLCMSRRNLLKTLERNPQAIWIDQDNTSWFDLANSLGMKAIRSLNEHTPRLEVIDFTFPDSVAFVAKPCLEDVRIQTDVATRYHGTDQTPLHALNPQLQCYSVVWVPAEKCILQSGNTWADAMILRGNEIQNLSIPGVIV